MLNLCLYYQTQSLYQEFFLANDDCLFIAPGPIEADEIRKKHAALKVKTIAEFLRGLTENIKPTRKSELYHHLSLVCKKISPKLKISEFDEVFKWLTDIRNNISDQSVMKELYSLFEEEQAKLLTFCSEIIDSQDYWDEAKVYRYLIEENHGLKNQKILFIGFKHLSSIQLDFFQSISQNNDIYISCPQRVHQDSEHNDWVQWGSFDKVVEIDNAFDRKGIVISISPARLPKYLRSKTASELCFFSRSFKLSDISLFAQFHAGLKAQVDFFDLELEWVEKKYLPLVRGGTDISVFTKHLKDEIFKAKEDWIPKRLKILLELENLVIESKELTDSLVSIDEFFLKSFLNVIGLNLPRISLVSNSHNKKLKNARSAEFNSSPNCLGFVDQDFLRFDYSFDAMPIELKTKLAQLGVIKRAKVEESYNLSLIEDFLSENERVLIYEESEELSDLFDGYNKEQESINSKIIDHEDYLKKEFIRSKKSYFSASRLQSFLDCPRRYEYQYLTNLLRVEILDDEVSAFEKGNWEHLLIKNYFEDEDKNKSPEIYIEKELVDLLAEKKLPAGELEILKADSKRRVLNGIEFVKSLQRDFPKGNFYFEKSIDSENFRGSIDLLINLENTVIVIDFKRSKGSIPSFSEIKNFESIQALVYLNRSSVEKDFTGGYFCLDTPEDSLFFGTMKELSSFRYRSLDFNFFAKYPEFEFSLMNKINENDDFNPDPRRKQMCNYCDLRNLCPKK